jgi:methionine-rich copper-binding protein CopC
VCLVAALPAVLPAPAAGSAAGGLQSSTPADGAVLSTAPSAVELTFASDPDLGRSHVTAHGADGQQLDAGSLVRAGTGSVRLPVTRPARGTVVVVYHAVLAGGEEPTGQVRFSVGTGAPPSTADAPATHQHGPDPLSATLLVLDAVVLVGAVLMLKRPSFRRPRGLD